VDAQLSHITRFEDRVKEWQGVWGTIDLRSICFQQTDGWRNAIATVRLLAGEPTEYQAMEMTYQDERFAVVQEIADIAKLDDFIGGLQENQLRIGDRAIRLDCPVPPAKPGGQVTAYNYGFESQPRRWARGMNYVATDYLTFVLQGRGRQVAEFVATEDSDYGSRVLFGNERPFEGFSDLMRTLFAVTYDFDLPGMPAMLTVLAPSYARIESAEQIDGQNLSVRIQGPPQSGASSFRLNSIMRALDGSAQRSSLEFTNAQRIDAPGYARFVTKVRLARAPLVDIFLLFRGERVDEMRLVLPIRDTPNPRLVAHLLFDDEGEKLRAYLFPETPKASAGFQMAVSWLLHFCGFEVASYGVPPAKLNDEIDLLAFVPFTKAVMCIECKATELKTDKLVLLANRWAKLKAALADYDIVAAAATALDHATEPEQKQARGLNISILTKIELEEMLTMAQRHASAQEIMEYVRRKVPSSP
jgi:hypothetical protein